MQIPHAMTLSTAGSSGLVSARTVILKDVDASGWWFAASASSPRAATSRRTRTRRSPSCGGARRQVRSPGRRTRRSRDERGGLPGPLGHFPSGRAGRTTERGASSQQDYRSAFAAELERVQAEPTLLAPGWTAYALRPTSVEFWQASSDRGQTRLRYRAAGHDWTKGLLWP
ncbi:pyridoxine 5'-phosphate oxidase C-terminal domain-containing protein [Oerskovia sp. M15]